jgi:hypothetical protein
MVGTCVLVGVIMGDFNPSHDQTHGSLLRRDNKSALRCLPQGTGAAYSVQHTRSL